MKSVLTNGFSMATTSSPTLNPLTPEPTSTTTPATSVTAEDERISTSRWTNRTRKQNQVLTANSRIWLSSYIDSSTQAKYPVVCKIRKRTAHYINNLTVSTWKFKDKGYQYLHEKGRFTILMYTAKMY